MIFFFFFFKEGNLEFTLVNREVPVANMIGYQINIILWFPFIPVRHSRPFLGKAFKKNTKHLVSHGTNIRDA